MYLLYQSRLLLLPSGVQGVRAGLTSVGTINARVTKLKTIYLKTILISRLGLAQR